MTNKSYDWAAAALAVELCDASDIATLVAAADLDPKSGDVSDIDLSNMDLRNQKMAGWDLRNATFRNSRIADADLREAIFDPDAIADAQDWQFARFNEDDFDDVLFAAIRRFPVKYLEVSSSTIDFLTDLKVASIGDLMKVDEMDMAASLEGEPKNILELKEVMEQFSIQLMDPPESSNLDTGIVEPQKWVHIIPDLHGGWRDAVLEHMDYLKKNYVSGRVRRAGSKHNK